MKTQIIFTCARCGKEQIENLNRFTVRRFKYRNLIGKDTRGYKLDKEICPDCFRSLQIWLNNGYEYKELVDERNTLRKLNISCSEQMDILKAKLREAESKFSSCKMFCPKESSDWREYQKWYKEKHKESSDWKEYQKWWKEKHKDDIQ